jgi:AraC-like DNA-binding protein
LVNLLEQHLTPAQIAQAWGVSLSYVRARFRREAGVLKCGRALRIPQSVAERVYRSTLVQPATKAVKTRARRDRAGRIVLVPAA